MRTNPTTESRSELPSMSVRRPRRRFGGQRLGSPAAVALGLLLVACGATGAPATGPSPVTPVLTVEPTNTASLDYPAAVLGLVVDPGLRVVDVEPGSGAARAGVQRGDVLVALDGTPLTSVEQGQQVARAATIAGDHQVRLALRRAGQTLTIAVQPLRPAPGGNPNAPLPTVTGVPIGYGYY